MKSLLTGFLLIFLMPVLSFGQFPVNGIFSCKNTHTATWAGILRTGITF